MFIKTRSSFKPRHCEMISGKSEGGTAVQDGVQHGGVCLLSKYLTDLVVF